MRRATNTVIFADQMSVAEWIDKYYRRDRLHSAEFPGRRKRIIADRENDLRDHGETLISRHDSTTGDRILLLDVDDRMGINDRESA